MQLYLCHYVKLSRNGALSLLLKITFRYGIEQEYTLLQTNVKWPLGWPVGGYPGPQVTFILFTLRLSSHSVEVSEKRGSLVQVMVVV